MRVLERFNETARVKKWPLSLGLDGIEPVDLPSVEDAPPAFDPAILSDAETSLRWLLEKFVDEPWFAEPVATTPNDQLAHALDSGKQAARQA
jgi:hypothetical protein